MFFEKHLSNKNLYYFKIKLFVNHGKKLYTQRNPK